MADVKLRSPLELFARDDDKVTKYRHKKRVGDYLIGRCIGKGSFATVYEAMHVPTGEKVAVKAVSKQRCLEDEYTRKNLRREGSLLQKLRHSHLIQLYEVLETRRTYYLVMELCTGESLLQRIERSGPIEEPTARRYLNQIVTAVRYLHEKDILHRDLKVENLLLSEDDNVKIIDFGLSTHLSRPTKRAVSASRNRLSAFAFAALAKTKKSQSADGPTFRQEAPVAGNAHNPTKAFFEALCLTQCGSPAYTAPEVLGRKPYGQQADVWSIGVNLYVMLTGALPFTHHPFSLPGLLSKMLRQEINPFPSHLSKAAIDLIRGLLTPDPKERLRLPQLIAHPWLTGTEQVKPSIPQADEFPLEFTSSVDVAAEVGRPHRLKRAGCGRRASNAKSQSPYGSRSPQNIAAQNEDMRSAGTRHLSLNSRSLKASTQSRLVEDKYFSQSDFEEHESRLTPLIIAYLCSGAHCIHKRQQSVEHLRKDGPPREKSSNDIVQEVSKNVPGQITAAYNLLKQKVRRYCQENNVKFSLWLASNKVAVTVPSGSHTTHPNELPTHWTAQEGSQSQPKTFVPTKEECSDGHWISELHPVFTRSQWLYLTDQPPKRMQNREKERKFNERASELETSFQPVPSLPKNGLLDEHRIGVRGGESTTTISALTSRASCLREERTLMRMKPCSNTISSVDGDIVIDVPGPSADYNAKLGDLEEVSHHSTSTQFGHRSRIDAECPCVGTLLRFDMLEPLHLAGTAGLTIGRKIKSILRKTGQTSLAGPTPLPSLLAAQTSVFEHERQREDRPVSSRGANKANPPPVLNGERCAVTTSPIHLSKHQSPRPQALPRTARIPDTVKRSRASTTAVLHEAATTHKRPPPPPPTSRPLPRKTPVTEQTYVRIHNRATTSNNNRKQPNMSPFFPVLLTPNSARRRLSTSPVTCFDGPTRAKTLSPVWQGQRFRRPFSPHQPQRTTGGSGEKRQRQKPTLPLFQSLYTSVFEC